MNKIEEKAYRTNTLGVADYEYYILEAKRLRAEAMADLFYKIYLFFKPKAKGNDKANKNQASPLRPAF